VTFQGEVSVSNNKRPLVVWLTVASQRFQKTRIENFPTSLSFDSCVKMGRTSTVHSACRVLYCACFWSSDETYTMLLPGTCRGGWTRRQPRTSKTVGHPKSAITKSANFVNRPKVQNFLWMLVAHTY